MRHLDDSALIRRACAGERAAFAELARRHRGAACAAAHAALGNLDDAQDVAQEAFVYAFLRLTELRDSRRFLPWLRQIVLNRCIDYRRRRGTRRLGAPLSPLTEAAEEALAAESVALRTALASLTEDHRTTVLLHYVGGWSHEEVAALLELPVATVRSRLMAAKRRMRTDLASLFPENPKPTMSTQTLSLSDTHSSLLYAALPGARILSLQESPEPWMPFRFRIRVDVDGVERTVDIRDDISPERAALLPALTKAGVPGPRLLTGPVPDGRGGWLSLAETVVGENLLTWALGGTPHRIRLATERAFEAIDRLQGATEALQADPAGAALPRRTLGDELAALVAAGGAWLSDPWFVEALEKTRAAASAIDDPLVYTDYVHFFPNFYRIAPESEVGDAFGWPGDPRLAANPVVEVVSPWGHFGDPLLGLAMVWIYDCYPVVHTGFVEQFLWRRGVSRKEFAPRLAIKALHILQREARPGEEGEYPGALRAWLDQAVAWL